MWVLIEQKFFAGPDARSLLFLEVFGLARDGRHTLLTKPLFGAGDDRLIEIWLAELPGPVAEEVRLVLNQGVSDATKLLADAVGITLTDASQSDWKQARIQLCDAVRLLRMPLGLLLENRRADLHFLLALAPPTQRQQLQSALEKGWVEVLHGGGLEEMQALIEELQVNVSQNINRLARLLRLWVMFDRDSDRHDRTQCSSASLRLQELCAGVSMPEGYCWSLSYYQLGRRTIENYLPEPLLRQWQLAAYGGEKTKRRQAVNALCELRKIRPLAAHQLNMKRGLYGDLDVIAQKAIRDSGRDIQDHELDQLFQGLPKWVRKALSQGFGKDVARFFAQEHPGFEEAFRSEFDRHRKHSEPSRQVILDSLFARL
jgi:hypothetical protein